jgi:predicted transcriptional regulator YheO
MKFENEFLQYKNLKTFLSDTFGNLIEITIYDLKNNINGELISKSSNCIDKIGSPLPKTLKKLLKNYSNQFQEDNKNFLTKFPGKDLDGSICRISTIFIKNNENNIIGMFSIKTNISSIIDTANYLNYTLKELTGGPERNLQKESEEIENNINTMEEYAEYLINQHINSLKKPIDSLSVSEKIEIIKSLAKMGIFNLKGSISEIALRFNTSEKTIYRYLNNDF